MEWNLLMGRYSDRLGYTWVEFGRRLRSGEAEYVNLGCGLKAAEGRGLVAHWFFITKKRIGADLFLAENRTAHSKARIEQAIGSEGKVFTKASDYRQAVDAKLFGLGPQYEALLNLLVQLRQPQLSRKLDEERLSAALSEALPPLSEKLLADVAEAFRGLETEGNELANLKAAKGGVEIFLTEYRRYAQIAARRHAERLLSAQSEHGRIVRKQKQSALAKQTAEDALADLKTRVSSLNAQEAEITARQQALHDSPEMRSATALEMARVAAEEAAEAVEGITTEAQAAKARVEETQKQLDREEQNAETVLRASRRRSDLALVDARAADMEDDHRRGVDVLDIATISRRHDVDAAEQSLAEAAERRLKNISHLESLESVVTEADKLLQKELLAQSQLETQLSSTRELQTQRQHKLDEEVQTTLEQYEAWTRGLSELRPLAPRKLDELFPQWVETGGDASPLETAVQGAWCEAQARLSQERARTERRQSEVAEMLKTLMADQRELQAGRHRPPLPPPMRDLEGRTNRPGGPFWSLCDFRDEMSLADRAGLEAALEAAGLLDAWVTPEGRVIDPLTSDTVIVTGISPVAPKGQTLEALLQPEPKGAVAPGVVAAVLRQIGLGEGVGIAWVAVSGQWQLGPLRGAGHKPAPQHIGASARETERLRRLAELEQQTVTARTDESALLEQIAAIEARATLAQKEVGVAPSSEPIRQAIAECNSITAQANLLCGQVGTAEKRVRDARAVLNAATQTRAADARDLGLERWIGQLQKLKEAVHAYRMSLAGLWPSLRELVVARAQAKASEQRVGEAREATDRVSGRLEAATTKQLSLVARYDTLQSSVGATVQELEGKLAAIATALKEVGEKKQVAQTENVDQTAKLAVAQSNLLAANEELGHADRGREGAAAALLSFSKTRLLSVAHDDFRDEQRLDWTTKGAVETAKRVGFLLKDVASEDPDWKRSQESIFSQIEELKRTLLPRGFSPEPTTTEEGIFIVNVPFQGRACSMTELHEALAGEIGTRQTLLDAREREVLENYLIDEAASELHDRLRAAEDWVRKATEELARRPMGSGMALRFDWQPRDDGPPGLAPARKQLLRLSSTWSPSERTALGDFLQEQIRRVREQNQTGTWQQHLADALDYRRWHRFAVQQKRERDGEWKRLTRRTHGTGSGGEKALALTMPQFAAAAAHYSASPSAPRLILLDEAFVGVDTEMRRKCMDLLASFDLDVVMTSEREWGCYPTVPALAIYQLARRDGIDAVGISRWVWNGKQRLPAEEPSVVASAPEMKAQVPTDLRLNGL